MRFKIFTRVVLLAVVLSFFCSILGVFATWKFSEKPTSGVQNGLEVHLKDFFWSGLEDLPHDVEGEDHEWLIRNLVMGVTDTGKEIGLNNSDSKLNDYIKDRLDGGIGWERDYFGSMAVTGGSEVEELFGTKAAGLSFIIEVVSDVEYYIYTTSVALGERGEMNFWGTANKTPGKPNIPIGEYIYPVYKTRLERPNKNSDWNIVNTERGKAKSDWYDENRRAGNATQIPSFDIKTWVASELGQAPNASSAIWTFVGDDPTAYATSSMPEVFYRIAPTSARTITITSENTKAKLKVYSSSGGLITQSSKSTVGGKEIVSVSFSASATTYYVGVTGDKAISFNVN